MDTTRTELIHRHDDQLAMMADWLRHDSGGEKEHILRMIDAIGVDSRPMAQVFAEFAYLGMVSAVLSLVNEEAFEGESG